MAEIPVKNNGKTPLPVAGAMVQPGETRHFEESHVPPHLRPAAPEKKTEPAQDPVLAILDHKVADVVEMLPAFNDEELATLKEAEENGNTRKSLMKAIAEEELKRADAKAGAGDQSGENQEGGDGEGDQSGEGTEGGEAGDPETSEGENTGDQTTTE